MKLTKYLNHWSISNQMKQEENLKGRIARPVSNVTKGSHWQLQTTSGDIRVVITSIRTGFVLRQLLVQTKSFVAIMHRRNALIQSLDLVDSRIAKKDLFLILKEVFLKSGKSSIII